MLDKHITRLVKSDAGGGRFESIDDPEDVVKLAGRAGELDLVEEFGIDPDRDRALDSVTRLAIGAGFDALRDAGIPLVQHYKLTSLGTQLPVVGGSRTPCATTPGWCSPPRSPAATRSPTSSPGTTPTSGAGTSWSRCGRSGAASATTRPWRRSSTAASASSRPCWPRRATSSTAGSCSGRSSMGHSQFAEIIGARGPNTQVNSACASTTQAIALAEDWIRAGRCRRVVVVAGDNVTSDHLIDWVGSGFLASGAAATDDVVENAALPFDNRRHGMIMGMGAAGLVVESAEAARERGIRPICEVLATVTANSAFHGTRLDVEHIGLVMEQLVRRPRPAA